MACRLSGWPSLSCAIERREPSQSRATRASRVGSPSAENTFAAPADWRAILACALAAMAARVRHGFDVQADVLHLLRPALVVHAERFRTATGRNALEARFGQGQHGACTGGFEAELDQRWRLGGVVDPRLDRVRMPAQRKQPLRLHPLHDGTPDDVLVA